MEKYEADTDSKFEIIDLTADEDKSIDVEEGRGLNLTVTNKSEQVDSELENVCEINTTYRGRPGGVENGEIAEKSPTMKEDEETKPLPQSVPSEIHIINVVRDTPTEGKQHQQWQKELKSPRKQPAWEEK
ncbi:hypothetical protein JTB14_033201 [Gonioctena quinquepunctata]|nr:hypothetical protein JTB14_033201 [Gonioctena quinquepunctata]